MKPLVKIIFITTFILFSISSLYAQEGLWKELNDKTDRLMNEGSYSEAINTAKEALSVAEKTFGADHPNLVETLNILFEIYVFMDKESEARAVMQKALAIQEKAYGVDDIRLADTLDALAFIEEKNPYTQEMLYKRALSIREKAFGQDDSRLIETLENLYFLYLYQGGRDTELEQIDSRISKIRKKSSSSAPK